VTAVCVGGGPSQIKPGVEDNLVLSNGGAGLLFLVPGLEWLTVIAPVLGFLAYKLPDICMVDPPAFPTFTVAEVFALYTFTTGDNFNSGFDKVKQTVTAIVWNQYCECVSGTQPTLPAAPTNPGGTTVVQPPQLALGKCASYTSPTVGPVTSDLTDYHLFGTGFGGGGVAGQLVPTGSTSVVLTMRNITNGAVHDSEDFLFYYYTSPNLSGNNLGGIINVPAGATVTRTLVLPAGANGFSAEVGRHTNGLHNTNLASMTVDVYCGGIPGQAAAPCCPPDDRLTQLLMTIMTQVNLIQRQGVPFGYIPQAVHSGLSGAGTIDITGLIGAAVTVTTIPASYGREGSSPTVYFEMGFVTFGTPDGYPSSYRVDKVNNVYLPTRCGAYTVLSYDLAPGVVVTITELAREP
jgi:hypothetical protein